MLAAARTSGRARVVLSLAAAALLLAACSEPAPERVVRGADDVQVMTPQEVTDGRLPAMTSTTAATTDTLAPGETVPPGDTTAETIPLNKDDRPPELRLFDAFGKFRSCLEDKGYGIEGDLLDPQNPAYQDPAYVEAVSTCAARTDIVNVLQEVQATRANLTPEEVEARNEVFTVLRTCLEGKGWTVETTTSEIGLLEPAVFQNAEGVLDERDINQCLSEQRLGED
ncbi:MAG: hypothetical protein ABMA25_12940 [Ilumatobacteraceae bacterium]